MFPFQGSCHNRGILSWLAVAVELATMNEDEILIGTRDGWGQQMPFGMSLPDLRQHIYVIGKTGSGIRQSIEEWQQRTAVQGRNFEASEYIPKKGRGTHPVFAQETCRDTKRR